MADTTPIEEAFDHSELEGDTFFDKPVLELSRGELLTLAVYSKRKIDHLEETQMTSERIAEQDLGVQIDG